MTFKWKLMPMYQIEYLNFTYIDFWLTVISLLQKKYQNYYQNIITNKKSFDQILITMNLGLRTPDAQSHVKININNQPTEFIFRYFSPEKHQQSSNTNQFASGSRTHSKKNSALQNSSIAGQALSTQKRKVQLDPQNSSDKFYNDKIQQLKYNSENFYEQFQKKLFHKATHRQTQHKKVKLRLLRDSKKKSVNNTLDKNRQNVKKIQISLKKSNKNQGVSLQHKPVTQKKNFDNKKADLVIRLYDQQNKNQKNRITQNRSSIQWPCYTPRPKTTSKRKGIKVYSSASTNKSSKLQIDGQTFTEGNIRGNYTGSSFAHISKTELKTQQINSEKKIKTNSNEKQKQKQKGQNRLGYILLKRENRAPSPPNESLKSRVELTKKRVYSKSKIGKKSNPVSRVLFLRDKKQQYHKFS